MQVSTLTTKPVERAVSRVMTPLQLRIFAGIASEKSRQDANHALTYSVNPDSIALASALMVCLW